MSNNRVQIDHIETVPFRLPMHGALHWGKAGSLTEVRHVAVRVALSDGSCGWAEAPPRPTIYGETVYSITSVIEHELAPRCLDLPVDPPADRSAQSPMQWPACRRLQARLHEVKFNHTAKAAIDMALHAALAEHQGISLLEHLLAGRAPSRDRIRVSYILGIGDRETVLQEAQRMVDQGVRVLKVKVGRDWRADLACIEDLQSQLGPDVALYADANECLPTDRDGEEAASRLRELAARGVLYCEEPLPVTETAARARLRAAQALPLIADDSAFTPAELQRELHFDTFDILNIKTARTGFSASAAMLHAAQAANKGVMVGSQASTGLGTRHAALFAALPGVDHPSELSFPLKLQADLLTAPLPIHDGYLHLTDVAAARLDPDRLRDAAIL